MAEFTRKARNRRVLQNIDTTKASKKEVFEFYKAWKKQYQPKGKPLDFSKVKKADIVRELYQLEAYQHAELQPERQFEREYERIKQKIKTPGQEAVEAFKKLQKKAEKLEAAGKLSKGKARLFEATTEQAKPRYKQESRQRRTQRDNVHYKGRYAHDFIKKMVNEALIDTEDFEDSKEIWYAIGLVTENSEEFDFFAAFYAGDYKKGSRDYYLGEGGFEDFLRQSEKFERDMKAKGKKLPEYGTAEYWNAFKKWSEEQEGSTKL